MKDHIAAQVALCPIQMVPVARGEVQARAFRREAPGARKPDAFRATGDRPALGVLTAGARWVEREVEIRLARD